MLSSIWCHLNELSVVSVLVSFLIKLSSFSIQNVVPIAPIEMPCTPTPCGLNSQCRELDNHAVCSCLPDMIGAPPNCRPECLVSSECALEKSCINQKCKNPCIGVCGLNARCQAINHNPICSCELGFSGDPLVRCLKEEIRKKYRFCLKDQVRHQEENFKMFLNCLLRLSNRSNRWLYSYAMRPQFAMS